MLENPCCCEPKIQTCRPVAYRDGAVRLSQPDIVAPGGDGLFGYSRFFATQPSGSNYVGLNSYNWWTSTLPYASQINGTTVAINFNGYRTFWFSRYGSTYTPLYPGQGITLTENTTLQQLTFTETREGKIQVLLLNSLSASSAPGQFISSVDWNGVQTSVTSRTGSQINEVQRSYTINSVTTVDSLLYSYVTSGGAVGLLQSVMWRQQAGGGTWDPIKQCLYGYYGASDANGTTNDLQSATRQLSDGSGGWNTVSVDYYRYWLAGSATGFAHALKMHIGPEGYRRLFNDGISPSTASDATMMSYADEYFEYDPTSKAAVKEISAVCSTCVGGGNTTDLFSYASNPSNPPPGPNVWSTKTTQTLPDGSRIVTYCNNTGTAMLVVNIDPTGTNMWATFYRFNAAGQVIWKAHPSAVALPASLSTLEAYNDLLNFNATTGQYEYLNNSTGLIEITNYYSSTNISIGAVQAYVSSRQVQQGQTGTAISRSAYTYTSNTDSSGNAVYPVATETSYPVAGSTTTTITTSYAYTWYSGTNQMQQRTTTLPVIATAQNGSGSAYTIIEQWDATGNLTQRTDERGIVNTYAYSVLGLVSEEVLNVQSGVTQPGVNVTTDFTYDNQGRLSQTLKPSHTVVISGTATTVRTAIWNLYIESAQPGSGTWAPDQNVTGAGYATGTGPSYTYTLINPVTLVNADKDGRTFDRITSRRTTGSGALSPTDTFAQTDWQSWTNTQYDDQYRTTGQSVYFLIPSSGSGTVGTNYAQTVYGYDSLERRNRVVAPGGTITRTVWATPQRVASVWVGNNDTGATDSNPAGSGSPNNMVMVTANVYDGGTAGGDGNLTQQTQYAYSTDTRVTGYGYDFMDRKTSTTDALNGYTVYAYDNLDRQTQVQRYASSGGNLIAQNATNYDDRSRVYQQVVYAVDPSTGTVGNSLVGNSWYDPSGNLLQQINTGDGQVFTKSSYNGVRWIMATYTGYNPSGTSYSQAGTVTNDIIVEQAQNTFDEVGNLVSRAGFQRLNDAPSSGAGSTGALSYGTQPEARVSYTANWFDGINRTIASASYGAIAGFTRPSTPPSSSSTVLVSSTSYNDAGEPSQTTDPMGYVTQTTYDAAARITQTVEDYGTAPLLNRTTNWTYTLDNLIATMTAVNSTTGDQTTTYSYGTTLTTSGVARNDLLASVTYPDSVSGSDVVSYTYNRQGQQATITDQRGTVRTPLYDKLGRLTDDCVTTVGSSTDNTVLRISTTYEVRGMVATVTSYNNATPGSGTALNQCALTYNSFAQLTEEQQDHNGTASGSSPNVQYAYDSGASGSNELRLNGLTYPNTRVVNYNYASGMDATLNRLTSVSDTGVTLASYTYLGFGTVVRITYPQPSVWLDLWGGTSGTFAGLDLFDRIIDQRWQNSITGTPTDIDRYQYGYDQNSNRLYRANVVGTPVVSGGLDEYYTYDHLNRLTDMKRGTLNSTKTGITGTPSREIYWQLDPTGNWPHHYSKTNGTLDLFQNRTSNTVNEITAITGTIGGTWITPAYDAAGNTTTMPQPATPTSSYTSVYDAWNRMVSISASGTSVGGYAYDGRNRRIVKTTSSETRHFYFTDIWQDIEERVGTSTSTDKQYVWGIRYVDELVCRDDATPERLYACQDANFNLTSIADASGNVQERFVYDPYGADTVLSSGWTSVADLYEWTPRFSGARVDTETRIYYCRQRSVHVQLGRFVTRDPLTNKSSANSYEYVKSSPLNLLDPSGSTVYDDNSNIGKIDILYDKPVYIDKWFYHFRGLLFAATWTPPTTGDWAKPCSCKPCQRVVFVQSISWNKEPGYVDWDETEQDKYGYAWDCSEPGSTDASTQDQPGKYNVNALLVPDFTFKGQTTAKCVKGKDAGTMYARIDWGFDYMGDWITPFTIKTYRGNGFGAGQGLVTPD